MKCKACNGKGYFTGCVYESDEVGFVDKDYECAVCHGTGQIEQTNEEHIQSCNHKELTEILFRMIVHGSVIRPDRQYISEWLKQPHT